MFIRFVLISSSKNYTFASWSQVRRPFQVKATVMSCSLEHTRESVERMLCGLNSQQKKAVTAPASGRLQIIAGPGTGKTTVLISRVAYLLLYEGISAKKIVVTTFTKKAANEMIERLSELLQGTGINASDLIIGTFHSICFRIIKTYGLKIQKEDYSIADERDSNSILLEVLQNLNSRDLEMFSRLPDKDVDIFKSSREEKKHHGYDVKKIKKHISKLKAHGIISKSYSGSPDCNLFLSCIYTEYEVRMNQNRLLDFDDCLLCCHSIISKFPVLNFVEHVLVDEFQDTNEIQLQLMYEFARGHPAIKNCQNNVTIVGDPDQSIYGFRDAQAVNFEKMKSTYKDCKTISLIENYRSTSEILNLSESIMRQQNKRVVKNLQSQMIANFPIIHSNMNSPENQARWISCQIKYFMALPNSIFKYNDISVLVRAAYQTRVIENEFVKNGIPYMMLKGKAFWERKEVAAILDYLRVVASPNDRMAYLRTLVFPKKSLGEKSIEIINEKLEKLITNDLLTQHQLPNAPRPTIHLFLKTVASTLSFKLQLVVNKHLNFIENCRSMLESLNKTSNNNDAATKRLVGDLFDKIYEKSGLKAEFGMEEDRELNIMEVKRQFLDFEPPSKENELSTYIGGNEEEKTKNDENILSQFIEAIGLFESDNQTGLQNEESAETDKGKVILSTIHGAKGLEWPIVFVPGLSEGILPASFAMGPEDEESINEERRCFYVATSRAKSLLLLSSYCEEFGKWGRKPVSEVSRFIKDFTGKENFKPNAISIFKETPLVDLYSIMKKDLPLFDVATLNRKFEKLLDSIEETEPQEDITETQQPATAGFTSAKTKKEEDPLNSTEGKVPSNKFKRHRPTPNIDSFIRKTSTAPVSVTKSSSTASNKAPPYIPSRKAPAYIPHRTQVKPSTCTTGSTASTKNKAPPYIPVRRAPAYIPRRNRG